VTAAPGDIVRSFPSPDGRVVDVIVKHPTSKTSVYKMRVIQNGELPDCYFPLAVKLAVAAGASELVIPKSTYDFQHPTSGKLIDLSGRAVSPGFMAP
jgi:hypothetical protein